MAVQSVFQQNPTIHFSKKSIYNSIGFRDLHYHKRGRANAVCTKITWPHIQMIKY